MTTWRSVIAENSFEIFLMMIDNNNLLNCCPYLKTVSLMLSTQCDHCKLMIRYWAPELISITQRYSVTENQLKLANVTACSSPTLSTCYLTKFLHKIDCFMQDTKHSVAPSIVFSGSLFVGSEQSRSVDSGVPKGAYKGFNPLPHWPVQWSIYCKTCTSEYSKWLPPVAFWQL